MNGIKKKIVLNFMFIILITILLLQGVFFTVIYQYYYNGVSNALMNHAQTTAVFANRYMTLSVSNLKQNIPQLKENFAFNPAELQLIKIDGTVLTTTSGFNINRKVNTEDVKQALLGEEGVWKGTNEVTNEKIMSVSVPILVDGKVAIIARYMTSLEQIDQKIKNIIMLSLGVGLAVMLIVFVISYKLASNISAPIKKVTEASRKIAKGRYDIKLNENDKDEIGVLSKSFNEMAVEINKTEQLKNEFISSMSHELRTPLTGIKGWSDTILTGSLDKREETERGLKIINKETDRLMELVEELLDFSRLEANNLNLSISKFSLSELLDEVILQMKIKAQRKKIQIQSEDIESIQIIADKNRLKQVFINIIDNAIKFSNNEGMIKVAAKNLNENEIEICVEDNGIGIEENHQKQVIQKFYQVDANKEGTGIGLAVVAQLVQLHKGQLSIVSGLNKGTTVTIVLPKEVYM
ncbi:sensor histidine kinase [Chengkuizengella axinellae]|uniref:histidine kinase n=1 Tax=Chengkuizengella axinellae TaxID=3064388 RepID=A0ABT9J4K0_9BACL|nr:HAMP domain-containing sensor histidine kinase [Chengkuizengella sp. 2205SS18-9]MDP5276392.1 HAMP domain-containing sensor histidine kinase [Chengkuizengella sp. 2205SS18-9]